MATRPISTPVTQRSNEWDCQRAPKKRNIYMCVTVKQTPSRVYGTSVYGNNPKMESYKVKMLKWIYSITMLRSILITNGTWNGDKVKAFHFFSGQTKKKIEKNAAHLLLIFSFFCGVFFISYFSLCLRWRIFHLSLVNRSYSCENITS